VLLDPLVESFVDDEFPVSEFSKLLIAFDELESVLEELAGPTEVMLSKGTFVSPTMT
jgi:hypothetical protein